MNKYLLRFILCSLIVAIPCSALGRSKRSKNISRMPFAPYTMIIYDGSSLEGEEYDFSATVTQSTVRVYAVGCQGKTLRIYNLVGDLVYEKSIDSESQTIRVKIKKGIYLVKISNKVRKIFVIE